MVKKQKQVTLWRRNQRPIALLKCISLWMGSFRIKWVRDTVVAELSEEIPYRTTEGILVQIRKTSPEGPDLCQIC